MANKLTLLEAARLELIDLEKQRGEVTRKISDLEKQAQGWGEFTNLDEAVKRIGQNALELEGCNQAQISLTSKVMLVRSKIEALQKEDKKAQAEGLKPVEAQALKAVGRCLLELDKALEELQEIQKEYFKLTGNLRSSIIDPGLNRYLKIALDRLKNNAPEILDLDPLPSPQEMRKIEARNNLARARQRLSEIENIDRTVAGSQYGRLLENAQEWVNGAATRLKELEKA